MTSHNLNRRTTYECVDKVPEAVPGSVGDQNGALLYHVEANCNGMPCPQYDPEKELTCLYQVNTLASESCVFSPLAFSYLRWCTFC